MMFEQNTTTGPVYVVVRAAARSQMRATWYEPGCKTREERVAAHAFPQWLDDLLELGFQAAPGGRPELLARLNPAGRVLMVGQHMGLVPEVEDDDDAGTLAAGDQLVAWGFEATTAWHPEGVVLPQWMADAGAAVPQPETLVAIVQPRREPGVAAVFDMLPVLTRAQWPLAHALLRVGWNMYRAAVIVGGYVGAVGYHASLQMVHAGMCRDNLAPVDLVTAVQVFAGAVQVAEQGRMPECYGLAQRVRVLVSESAGR